MTTSCSLILAVSHLWLAGQALATASPAAPFDIQWSAPVDGLALGIEVPKKPIRFVGYSDWKGPLTIWRDHPNGAMSRRYNPGGYWDEPATVTVHLQNVSVDVNLAEYMKQFVARAFCDCCCTVQLLLRLHARNALTILSSQ